MRRPESVSALSDWRDLEIRRLKRQLAEARTRLEEKQRQQRRVDAQYAVSRILEDSRDLAEAAPEIFRVFAERLGWVVGVLWTVQGDALRCEGFWSARSGVADGFEETTRGSRFPRGVGLPGRVWEREEPCWVDDVLEDAGFLRRKVAAAEGLSCALAFPIQDGGSLVGVFELFKGEPSSADDDLLRIAHLIGNQMGQFVERRRAEDERDLALEREREARRQAGDILESINDAFVTVDREWRFTYVNRQAERLWSRSRRDLIGKDLRELFPQVVGSDVQRELRRAMEEGETVGFETSSPETGDWILARAYPSADGISVYFQDITERKRVEEALTKSEERYRALFETMDEGFCVVEVAFDDVGKPRDYRFLETNPAFERHTGLRGATGRWMRELAPDHEGHWFEIYGKVAATGESVRFVNEAKALDGRWFDVYAFRLDDPEDRRVAILFTDITERRHTEEALTKSEARYRTLTANVPGAVFRAVVDGRGPTMEFVSGRIEEITGYPPQDFVTDRVRDYREVIHPEDIPKNERAVKRALDQGETYNIEYRILHADGGTRWVNERGAGIFSDGGDVLWIDGAIFDVTERRMAEEAMLRSAGRDALRVVLADALRPLSDPVEIQAEATRVLGEQLGANRSLYGEVSADGEHFVIERDYAVGTESFVGRHRMKDFGPTLVERIRAGTTLAVDDLAKAGLTEAEQAAYAAMDARSFLAVPLIKRGRWASVLAVYAADPRAWTAAEVALIEEVAERTWAAVERARAEEALRESRARLQLALDASDMGTFLWHVEEDRGEPDARMLALFGLPADGTLSLAEALATLIHPDDRAGYAEAVARATDPDGDGLLRADFRVVRPDGSVRWLAITAQTIFEGRPQRAVRMPGVATDVTERKRTEEALRENEEWLGIAQRAASSGTWEWDLTTGEVRWSEEHRELFGFDPETPITREGWWAAIQPEDLPRIEEAGRRCFEEGEEWPEIEHRILRAGETRWIYVRGRTLRDEGGRPARILGISVDVTERKQAERERGRLLALERAAIAEEAERERISRELHDRVAHSMAVVHQSLQLHEVLADKSPARAAERLELAREMAKTALESTRNLSAELRRSEAEEDLESELRNLLEVGVPPGVQAGLSVEGDESRVPGHVRGQLFLMLREAVRNAVIHSGCSSISVGLEVAPEEIVGRVEDDGRGFEAGDAREGVGLKSMRERAALLDGNFDLTCEPGSGTQVRISVPLNGGW